MGQRSIEEVLRLQAPQVLGALVRRFGHFDECEDAVQEALLAAAVQWPRDGRPDDPKAWLIAVAARRLTDRLRSEEAARRREAVVALHAPADAYIASGEPSEDEQEDSLALLFLCCHPSLSPPSQLALTLRAVGGLTTAQIARAFLVPEATMAQRISRAKQQIRASGGRFALPGDAERDERRRVVLHVLYLMFNEGYVASDGSRLHRRELAGEAIRLTRMLLAHLPGDGEVAGLLALMLLTEARSGARTGPDGALVPLAEQDRSRWDADMIREGKAIIADALARAPVGLYQVQAAIAAVHAEAADARDTDWPQIVALYEVLRRFESNPMVTLNQAVALSMAHGPSVGLAVLAELGDDARLANHHRLHAVRGHLLELAGDDSAARESYRIAAGLTTSLPERRYLQRRAKRLSVSEHLPR
jgi:RNA polymerase sigma factor (sigma-70 family)